MAVDGASALDKICLIAIQSTSKVICPLQLHCWTPSAASERP